MPDIKLADVHLTRNEKPATQIKEADLARHLSNPQENGGTDAKESAARDKGDGDESDYALSEALNLLKGLAILRPAEA